MTQIIMTGALPEVTRADLQLESKVSYPIELTRFRVHDAMHTLLPSAGAADDLGIVGGTFGSATPVLKTSDAKATSVTQYARVIARLPAEYDDGERVWVRVRAGMMTTVSDNVATVDVEAYLSDGFGGVTGGDLCVTGAQSINSLTPADKDFALDSSGLSPGDVIDIRLKIAITDNATATAVYGAIGKVALLCDVRG